MLRRYLARAHLLSKEWSDILARKRWATISEDVLHQGFAAWAFLKTYNAQRLGGQGIRLAHGVFAKVALEQVFLQHITGEGDEAYLGYSLGNATWAVLFWPVLQFVDGHSGFRGYYLDPNGAAEWKLILDPREWNVVRCSADIFNEQIFMVKDPGGPIPLLKFFLADPARHQRLTVTDLKTLLAFFGVEEAKLAGSKRAGLIELLVTTVDTDFVNDVMEAISQGPKPSKLGDALDELVLSELPAEDQSDFRHVADFIEKKHKQGWSLAENAWKKAYKPKAKAKTKAKAKAAVKKAVRVGISRWVRRKRKADEIAGEEPVPPEPEAPLPPEPEAPHALLSLRPHLALLMLNLMRATLCLALQLPVRRIRQRFLLLNQLLRKTNLHRLLNLALMTLCQSERHEQQLHGCTEARPKSWSS